MTRYVLLIILCGCGGRGLSQEASLKGRVLDSATRLPLHGVTIQLVDTLTITVVTDPLGQYRFEKVRPGDQRMTFSAAGYLPLEMTITVRDTLQAMPDIRLVPQFRQLDTVSVRSRLYSITPRADGYLYRINSDLAVAGERAYDILRRLPGLQVSPDGAPSIIGSSRIKVIIDGKPAEFTASSVSEALARLPAEMVATVEVVMHPGAKYEAEGVNGVILITTRKLLFNATTGNLNFFVSNRSLNPLANILLRRNKWIVDADASWFFTRLPLESVLLRQDNTRSSSGLEQFFKGTATRHSSSSGAGITVVPDSLTSASLNYRYSWAHAYTSQLIENRLMSASSADTFYRYTQSPFDRYLHSLSGSVNRRSRNKLNEYTFLANLFRQSMYNPFDAQVTRPSVKDYLENNQNQYITTQFVTQTDVSFSLSRNAKLETGMRYQYQDYFHTNRIFYSNASLGNYTFDAARSSSFGFRTSQSALHVCYALSAGRYRLRAGIRYEHTLMWLFPEDSAIRIPRYGNLLPNLLISRSFGETQMLSASYAQRLQRPYIVYLNPLVNYLDSFNIERGNPGLQPATIHTITMSYAARLQKVSLNAAFVLSRSLHNIEPVKLLLPGGIAANTWINISANTSYAVSAGFNYQDDHWSLNLNHTLSSVSFQTSDGRRSRWLFQNSAVVNYTFAKTWTLATYLTANTNTPTLQGLTTGTRWYNILLIKKFRDGRISTGLRLDNFFTHYQLVHEEINTADLSQSRVTKNVFRFFRLSLSWKLGKTDIRVPEARRRAIEN